MMNATNQCPLPFHLEARCTWRSAIHEAHSANWRSRWLSAESSKCSYITAANIVGQRSSKIRNSNQKLDRGNGAILLASEITKGESDSCSALCCVHILDNVINIFSINDVLFHPPQAECTCPCRHISLSE